MKRALRLLVLYTGALFAINTVQPDVAKAVPWQCPSSWWFNTPYTYIDSDNYAYEFVYTTGTFQSSLPGYPSVGYYTFPELTSTDGRAKLRNAEIFVNCTREYVVVPPYAQLQPVTFVFDQGAHGDLVVIYRRHDEVEECGDETSRLSPSGTTRSLTILDPKAPKPLKSDGPCNTGGNGPGGSGETWYCAYWDTYDLVGNLVSSILLYCWQAS
ncbi:MAG: hypothetical protein ABI969_03315 [bacterium]